MAQKFRFVGDHPVDLADGSVLEPGQFVQLNKEQLEDEHNKRLLADGLLIGTGKKSAETAETAQEKAEREAAEAAAAEANNDDNGGTS